ncbi:MAG: DUF3578 domain-containing protein [Thermaerobacter sp.]|nr:DUF3578 domain-containing protein [Thermaerobacter sp.]
MLSRALAQFLDNYPASKEARHRTPFADHPARQALRALQQALLQTQAVRRRPQVLVTGSVGQGVWAWVPWIALLDQRITTSAQSGLYVIFLFAADMSAVHLCLAFGVSRKHAPAQVAEEHTPAYDVAAWQAHPEVQGLQSFGFRFDPPDLKTERGIGAAYPAAVITHKPYPCRNLPEDPALERDLEALMAVYDQAVRSLAPASAPVTSPPPPPKEQLFLSRVVLSGFRSFEGFDSGKLGSLNVLIGPNGAGKSNFLDFLRFVHFAATHPDLPPALDPLAEARELFFAGGPSRLYWKLHFARGKRREVIYQAGFTGPQGAFHLQQEQLEERWPEGSFAYLKLEGNQLQLTQVVGRNEDGEPVYRQPIQPMMPGQMRGLWLARLRGAGQRDLPEALAEALAGWNFFGSLDTGPQAPARRPCLLQRQPQPAPDGSNLAAVLFDMQNEAANRPEAAWDELQLQLRLLVPGFRQLRAEASETPGYVRAVWEEVGWRKPLSLAEVSDGTLRLLYWLTLCLAPQVPPLVMADEPDAGLHPRVLPTLVQFLQSLAQRTQVVITTHSPYFLSQFPLAAVVVVTKEGGHTRFQRPGNSKALRELLQETEDAGLAQLFISEGLELFP